ncbi:MAG: hypothetical protein AB7E10_07640, partial [Burkholderiaceae bacterium]
MFTSSSTHGLTMALPWPTYPQPALPECILLITGKVRGQSALSTSIKPTDFRLPHEFFVQFATLPAPT